MNKDVVAKNLKPEGYQSLHVYHFSNKLSISAEDSSENNAKTKPV